MICQLTFGKLLIQLICNLSLIIVISENVPVVESETFHSKRQRLMENHVRTAQRLFTEFSFLKKLLRFCYKGIVTGECTICTAFVFVDIRILETQFIQILAIVNWPLPKLDNNCPFFTGEFTQFYGDVGGCTSLFFKSDRQNITYMESFFTGLNVFQATIQIS